MDFKKLKAGDKIYYTGVIYTARDQAHLRLKEMIDNHKNIPIDFQNALIYYAGPTPTKPGNVIGSIGPTTSSRMDKFIDYMKPLKIEGMIGKGPRSSYVKDKIKEDRLIYFVATGGAGALLSKAVISAKEVLFEDLGCESIKRLEVKDFPLLVAIDTSGNNIFERN